MKMMITERNSYSSLALALTTGLSLLAIISYKKVDALSLSPVSSAFLKLGGGKRMREKAVMRYFEGVTKKDREQIRSCFPETGATIRDVCGLSQKDNSATADQLADRCMEFVTAHPDCVVHFHMEPTSLRGMGNRWVFAHWYETGNWTGESCGVKPEGTPLSVEGQTRFLVNDDLKIEKIVVTRTFSDWEKLV